MVAMLQRVLSTPGFYYSFTYELTLCEQRKKQLAQQDKKFWQLPLHEKVCEFLNVHLGYTPVCLKLHVHVCLGHFLACFFYLIAISHPFIFFSSFSHVCLFTSR